MKKLLFFVFLLCSASVLVAQEADAPVLPQDEDVLYFKNGAVWRGHVVSQTAKQGKIQMRDGSIMVYNPKLIKMSVKEPVSNNAGAQNDSIRTVDIVKKVFEDEARKKQVEEDWNNLQKTLNEQPKTAAEVEATTWKLYSALEVEGGIGLGDLPAKDGEEAVKNSETSLTARYGLGARYGVFGIGLNLGIRSAYHSLGTLVASDSVSMGNIPSTLMYIPVGLDIRLDFAPRSAAALVMILNGSYALKINAKDNDTFGDFISFSPTIGLRFGRGVSSLLGVGYEMQMKDGDMAHFATLRFGVNF
ncbi:MAG: hypothetical protein LBK47_06520 [Prevotellaceae bacterium]|jgi:hypothetical protein|nr:hypothetical protein [Prevotellaceae bacterium]